MAISSIYIYIYIHIHIWINYKDCTGIMVSKGNNIYIYIHIFQHSFISGFNLPVYIYIYIHIIYAHKSVYIHDMVYGYGTSIWGSMLPLGFFLARLLSYHGLLHALAKARVIGSKTTSLFPLMIREVVLFGLLLWIIKSKATSGTWNFR